MKIIIENAGKITEINNPVAFDILTRDQIALLLENEGIFPSTKNVDAFIKALPVTYNGVPEETHLRMAMAKCKNDKLFTQPSVIEKPSVPGEGISTFSIENFLCDNEKVVYFAVEDDNYQHQLIYHESFGDLIALMNTTEGMTRIFEHTLERLLNANECESIIQYVTGLVTHGNECSYLHCFFGYHLPSKILWYDFNPRFLPVYAIKVDKSIFEAPFAHLFYLQSDLKDTCLEGIVVCGNKNNPVSGNLQDMRAWVENFPSLCKSYLEDTLSDEFTKLRKIFPFMLSCKEATRVLQNVCEAWDNYSETGDPFDIWRRNKPVVVQAVLELVYGEAFHYCVITNKCEEASSKQIVYYKENKFSAYAIKNLRAQYFDEGDTYVLLYKKPTEEMIHGIEGLIFGSDIIYDTAFVTSEMPEKAKDELERMLHVDVTVYQ